MKIKNILTVLFLCLLLISCGSPSVEPGESTYNPKIAVEAYLFNGEPVQGIKIMRNYPIGVPIDLSKIYLTPAQNSVTVKLNDIQLEFDPQTQTYFNKSIIVQPDVVYTLVINATIEGKQLAAFGTTRTPKTGFRLINKDLGIIKYRQSDANIQFTPSKGTDFYIFSLMADTAKVSNFIFDNPYITGLDSEKVTTDLNLYRYQWRDRSDINSYLDKIYDLKIEPFDVWFYGSYTTIVYAGDSNFKQFVYSSQSVKEFDGNFHEPVQNFSGDAIGVFASAIRDTVKFRIIK